MQQRVSLPEYEEWRSSFITEQLFNFFKLEAELQRRTCLELDLDKSPKEIGEEYFKRQYAARCYDMLGTIEYNDLFPEENKNESSQES